MGLIQSQRTLRSLELESGSNDIYKYPPKSGSFSTERIEFELINEKIYF